MSDAPRKASLLVIFLTVFIDLLGFGMVLPLLPIYAKDFAAALQLEESHAQVGWLIGLLMSSFSLMQFIFAPIWGRVSDRVGRRPILMLGLGGSVVFYSLFGVATVFRSLPLLFVSRIGAGIAGATISTAQAYIADATTLQTRARGMALIGAAFGLGFTFGPLFGALALASEENTAGPGPGYAAAGLSAIALAIAYFKLPESLKPGNQSTARRMFDRSALADALARPAVGILIAATFVCVFAFANFESTLSLMLNSDEVGYRYQPWEVSLVFAYIGLVLTLVQGGIVRRIAGRISERAMATSGAITEVVGFALLAQAANHVSVPLLLGGLAVVVSGFAFITPSLNSLLSRWSDPAKQGGILGIGQSVSSLARIFGPMAGVPLSQNVRLAAAWNVQSAVLPLFLAGALMAIGLVLIVMASSRGRDFPAAEPAAVPPDLTLQA
ncbi:MAG TPA: MFS transporter [Pirellulales bacterium]|jgi:DHA1 family tetracycline resistance protein-like MFS transporter|nr:MFS transporter [Pirellulales bacterium]